MESMTEHELFDKIIDDPFFIEQIEHPSYDLQLLAICLNRHAGYKIKNIHGDIDQIMKLHTWKGSKE
jgi:hypothetical protein